MSEFSTRMQSMFLLQKESHVSICESETNQNNLPYKMGTSEEADKDENSVFQKMSLRSEMLKVVVFFYKQHIF